MKRRSKTSPAPTARYGNAASPYTKYNKHATRYRDYGPLDIAFYQSVTRDAKGHPYRVRFKQIKPQENIYV